MDGIWTAKVTGDGTTMTVVLDQRGVGPGKAPADTEAIRVARAEAPVWAEAPAVDVTGKLMDAGRITWLLKRS